MELSLEFYKGRHSILDGYDALFCNINVCRFMLQTGAPWDISIIHCGNCEMGEKGSTFSAKRQGSFWVHSTIIVGGRCNANSLLHSFYKGPFKKIYELKIPIGQNYVPFLLEADDQAFAWCPLQRKCLRYLPSIWVWILLISDYTRSS